MVTASPFSVSGLVMMEVCKNSNCFDVIPTVSASTTHRTNPPLPLVHGGGRQTPDIVEKVLKACSSESNDVINSVCTHVSINGRGSSALPTTQGDIDNEVAAASGMRRVLECTKYRRGSLFKISLRTVSITLSFR